MAQTERKRDFKVLSEKIAPDNILLMAELLAIKETKTLVKFMGQHAIRAHATLCTDVFCKNMPDYTLSDNYDIVQSVAAFLCEHYGEHLDDFLYVSKRSKNISTKVECYLIVTRMLCEKYRFRQRYISLDRIIEKLEYDTETAEEEDYSLVDAVIASLNLTKNMNLALEYRMSGMSYPSIAKMLSRATSTIYEYFGKIRARYTAIYGA